ncbi:hypothetical protein LBMAG18_08390 [Alphaproteobacteria bacterium]|nr:hypothetical protein LBMAG18_08390 [Alphaproteobacteria bacterium]
MKVFVAWQVIYYIKVAKIILKLDKNTQQNLKCYFQEIASHHNPRKFAAKLRGVRGMHKLLWLFEFMSLKIICKIDQERMFIVVIDIIKI